jgi:hypothetical protein
MSAFKTPITMLPHPGSQSMQSLVPRPSPTANQRDGESTITREESGGFISRANTFFQKCWRRMSDMKLAFEQAGEGRRRAIP